jgi:hypothetical protein
MARLENPAHDEDEWAQTTVTYYEGHDLVQGQPHATPERAPKAEVDGSQRFLAG